MQNSVPVPPGESARVLVADDDALARAALVTILGRETDIEVVGECADGAEAVAEARRTHPHVALIDVRMPGTDGVMAVRLLQGLDRPPYALMMTAWDDERKPIEALEAGAAGFLLKDEEPEAFVRAVRHVAAGDAEFSPRTASHVRRWVVDTVTDRARSSARARLDELTPREREVAFALVSGGSDADLAGLLHVATSTIKSTLGAIHTKWGTRNRTQVAVTVARSGLDRAPGPGAV